MIKVITTDAHGEPVVFIDTTPNHPPVIKVCGA